MTLNAKNLGLDLTDSKRPPILTVLLLAWPVFLKHILTTLVGYADTAMVGAMGASATASVSISNSIVMLINGTVMSMGVGISALVARSVGARDYDLSKKLIRHTVMLLIYLGLPMGLILMALHRMIPLWMGAEPDVLELAAQYNLIVAFGRPFQIASMLFCAVYRGCGDTRTPLYMNTGVNVINVVGNFFLINPTRPVTLFGWTFMMPGAGLGVTGAAIATAVAMACGGIFCTLLVYLRESPFKISLKENYRIDFALTRQIMRISFPAMLERLCMSGAQVVIASSIASLGTVTVAANTVYVTAESIAFMPGFAFSAAVQPLWGSPWAPESQNLLRNLLIPVLRPR